MKINLNGQVLFAQDDKPLKQGDADMTAGMVVQTALFGHAPGDEAKKGDDKYKFYKLAKRIKKANGECEVTAEEVVTIKERVSLLYAPLIVGQIYDLIEGESG